MGELLGLSSILGSLAIAYWLFAAACIALALYLPKDKRRKTVAAIAAVIVFGVLPAKSYLDKRERDAYAAEAWAYFKKVCAEQAGEKIYKTFPGIRSAYVFKPLPAAKESDLYDQFWYGDPYSDATPWEMRGRAAATSLTLDSKGLDGQRKSGLSFIEIASDRNKSIVFQQISRPISNDQKAEEKSIEAPTSRFGISWEDISRPTDRQYWVAGSRLKVVDLTNNSTVAERIGYLIEPGFGSTAGQRRPWLASRSPNTTCPPILGGEYSDNWFIGKVFPKLEEK
jgi:hypothetical protein